MHNILFIHSDPKIVKFYEPLLSRHFEFDSAIDGLSGLRKIRLKPPGAVVSDYHLAHLSGLALLKFIRSQGHLAAVPFIFFADHSNLESALNWGANDWIVPSSSSPEILLNKIYQHLKYGIHIH
ncbi:MAG: hypothetical protein A3J07_04985 [Candidatus Doudnabacteria bacterium RIFCSPLOWO2_02_FULL_49_13]|uniref:Response regulatory domain-containing protein n=1 Tax=Candidatus Doudnabacteria bacterium RIFCSPHIGHO2_12_FULL_48_16 TaxID=1817838 RepID=A0A1F5PLD4_9BACT|nr:MAG: hypothetical protein A3B77_04625 [Candidatus Doudnabacteria bacterium RIFCSPHIGHO2_02_FULL_49_24]OGE88173.1 MAG: hypothetical protein A2760_02275 [Candidatus Doudnabacteria bacterium RIFCSPHIGHO2_01_FULL_50_67]OGE90482.1 MAG: hypothetical protein A3E29_05055 [Candidatus Doudnabacteria bacterium RIFCSPHIGHO2_12_FULL_48_16]OGE96544.1 MAG: hypothetical protein A2990_03500 [Candidatus Doudnabacteria bacterium RIFCSPLOWO2_01_FULL_49_40]OGF02684.1 MAG: hypothetical protein A3H14_03415 [Candid